MIHRLLALISILAPLSPLYACTAFLLENKTEKLLAKNYDWDLEHGYVLINKRNVKKIALSRSPSDKAAEWTSQYGSATFNQYGQEFPNSGMNEKGLAVEILWLTESVYPAADPRPTISELQWVQYQLDNFATVREVVANAPKIRVAPFYAKVHYFACDTSGECATFEYIKGQLVIRSGSDLTPKLLTNNTQEVSAAFLKKHQEFGGTAPIPSGIGSLARYVRAASSLKSSPISVPAALNILERVNQGDYTKWNVVYDLAGGSISFRTLNRPQLKNLALSFDFSCKNPALGFDLESLETAETSTKFETYTALLNNKLVEKSFATLGKVGKKMGKHVASYPASTVCVE
jgi:penicillin V acylase-like amidase (Ntn superfamily)